MAKYWSNEADSEEEVERLNREREERYDRQQEEKERREYNRQGYGYKHTDGIEW